ncbi:MAG: FtsX-like permease family protein, partial [Dehalococcoidia bacterium]
MNELFGISTTTIMIWLVGLLAVCLIAIGVIAITNPTMVKLGLRNIPRRKAESTLVVLGLMLATLIITAAFTTGDSIDYSITRDVYKILGPIDETITLQGASIDTDGDASNPYVDASVISRLDERFQDNPDIRGFIGTIQERVPVYNPETRLSGPRMLLSGVDQAQIEPLGGLRFEDGRPLDLDALPPDSLVLTPKAADILEAKTGDTVQLLINNQPVDFTVAGIADPELLTGWTTSGPGTRDEGGVTVPLAVAQELLDKPNQINLIGVSNTGGNREGVDRTDAVVAALEPVLQDEAERNALGLGGVSVEVEKAKQENLEMATTVGNIFTTIFIVLGLFSIAAGVLLIFMIFVMLAAERKTEMGMARAVGLKRRHLIESFTSEGMAYNLLAGLVGAALGVLAAWALVWVSGLLFGDSFAMDLRITPRSLVISYALGVVLTFITVVISSWRVSKLNIVAAIRDIQEDRAKRAGRGSLIWGIILTVVAALFMIAGQGSNSAFMFSLGMTVIVLSIALILRFFGLAARPVFTVAGALIFGYWSLPMQWSEALFGELNGDIEMFFLSGVGMVVGSTLVLVYNANVLTNLFQGGHGRGYWAVPLALGVITAGLAVLGVALRDQGQGISQLLYMAAGLAGLLFVVSLLASRAERFRPALKMAIAYPLASRFRTGMTIAMFSLIVFSITVMSILTQSFSDLFIADTARAGWDLTAIVNRNNPLPDFRAALVESGFSHPDDITAIGRSTFPTGNEEARVAGTEEWKDYPVIAADPGYFEHINAKMLSRASGYDSDADVWEAVRAQPGLAVVDGLSLTSGFGADPDAFNLADEIERDDLSFNPVTVEIQDPVSGRTTP